MCIVPFVTRMRSCGLLSKTLQIHIAVCLLFVLSTGPTVSAQESDGNEKVETESVETESEQSDGPDEDAAVSKADLKSDVLQWVDELDAASLSKRRAAEKSLIEAGPEALEFLPEKQVGFSVEAAERLSRVRSALQSLRTKEETSAEVIVIRLDQVSTLGEALEAISLESKVEFEYQADDSMSVDPVKSPLSFWHAVDYVLDQTNLDINFYGGGEGTLMLVPREEGRPSRVDSAAYAGVYRIEVTTATSRRNIRQPSMSGLNVGIEISWEPRLTPIGLTIPIDQLGGKLDDDANVEPQESGDSIDIATNADIAFSEFFFPLNLPSGQPEKIETLTGNIRALLPGQRQAFELPLAKPNEKKQIDAMTVEIETIRKNGPLHEIRVAVQLDDAGRALESHRQWIFENDVYVRRKDGSRTDHLGFEVFRQTDSGVGIGYLFDLG
ncbi:MAG: hypothetical protein AAGI63_09610, partial [Planctomycetota bacterium]